MEKVLLSTTLLTLISLTSLSLVMPRASAKCPDSWVMFGNSCYLFIAKITRWYDAQIICKSVDSSLVKIESPEENEFVFRLARNHRKTVWIGLIDLVQEGHFVWADTQRVSTYTRWSQGNPDNFEGEDCAALWFDREGFWNDYNCDTRLAAICEKHSTL